MQGHDDFSPLYSSGSFITWLLYLGLISVFGFFFNVVKINVEVNLFSYRYPISSNILCKDYPDVQNPIGHINEGLFLGTIWFHWSIHVSIHECHIALNP